MTPTWKNGLWLVIDTETTGLDPKTDRIVELATVTMLGGRVLARRSMVVNPGIPIPEQASAIHGITDEKVANAPRLADIAAGFLAMVRRVPVLVAYNAPFDIGFLRAELGEAWDEATAHAHVIDPLAIVRAPAVGKLWKGQGRHKLGSVAERFGIALEGDLHRAAVDAELAGLVLHRLLDHLPDDPAQAARAVTVARDEHDRDFKRWRASQAPLEPTPEPWESAPDGELV